MNISYSSRHLVLSHFGLAYDLLVETHLFPEFVFIFQDYAIPTSLSTFSILLASFCIFISFKMKSRYLPFCVCTVTIQSKLLFREIISGDKKYFTTNQFFEQQCQPVILKERGLHKSISFPVENKSKSWNLCE